jgi:hypothetical protein
MIASEIAQVLVQKQRCVLCVVFCLTCCKGRITVKKILSLVALAAVLFVSIGCDDKKPSSGSAGKPSTPSPAPADKPK